ncbi:hypothetical protein [uncultured Faecalibaculum sp.]|uniref:hypothetical protein n=1 Tax=uncultured Faecalibaculum sp. TaxID=1729681 RepID=UPI0025F1EF13|nr:hypothetical protein [uncultured Faecalibaculum sp.]
MELLMILLFLVFLLEKSLKLGLLGLKFWKQLRKTMKQIRNEKMPESSTTRSGGPDRDN